MFIWELQCNQISKKYFVASNANIVSIIEKWILTQFPFAMNLTVSESEVYQTTMFTFMCVGLEFVFILENLIPIEVMEK